MVLPKFLSAKSVLNQFVRLRLIVQAQGGEREN